MATKATSTTGVKLQRGDGAGTEVFVDVGEVTNISGPNESAAQVDVTSFASTAHEFISALPDSGEVTFDMNFVGSDATQQALRSDLRIGKKSNYKLVLNDHATTKSTCAFAAIVTALSGPQGGVDAAITQSCTLKVSGQPTWTYAAAS